MFVSLSENKVQILILFSRDYAIVKDLLLVVRGKTPSVTMHGLKQGDACPIEPRIDVLRVGRIRLGNNLDPDTRVVFCCVC